MIKNKDLNKLYENFRFRMNGKFKVEIAYIFKIFIKNTN